MLVAPARPRWALVDQAMAPTPWCGRQIAPGDRAAKPTGAGQTSIAEERDRHEHSAPTLVAEDADGVCRVLGVRCHRRHPPSRCCGERARLPQAAWQPGEYACDKRGRVGTTGAPDAW